MHFDKITLLCILCYKLQSCNDSTCIQTKGNYTEKTHIVDTFSTLNIYGMCDVHIEPDTCNYIEIKGGSKQIDMCEFKQKESSITWYNYSTCGMFKQFEHIQLIVHATHIDSIFVYTPCKLTSDTITRNLYISAQTEMIEADLHVLNSLTSIRTYYKAGGRIKISGESHTCNITANYAILVDCQNLTVSNASVCNNTIQDMYIQANDSLLARTSKSGYIYYKGNPKYIEKQGNVKHIK